MKYLLIENAGEIHPLALILMGASDKRDDTTKIGFYGSGNKYALALLLRLGIPFRIYSGTSSIEVHTEKEPFKDTHFDRIHLVHEGKRYDTSLTVQMGPQWEPWFIVREIYCNALDEGGCNVVPMVKENAITPVEGKTRFYIGINEHTEPVIANWQKYFCNDRIDLMEELPGMRVFMRKDQGMRVYRKGILVYDDPNKESVFDYDVDDAKINESRVLEDTWTLRYQVQRILTEHGTAELLKRLLLGIHIAGIEQKHLFEENMDFNYNVQNNLANWKEALNGFTFVNRGVAGRYHEECERANALVLPSQMLHHFQEHIEPDLPAFGIARKGGVKHSYRPYTLNFEQMGVLQKAIDFLAKANVFHDAKELRFEAVSFDESRQMGGVDMEKQIIYIGETAFDMGTKQVASTILEEYTHLKTKYPDESRVLQTYLFDKWLTEMELRTGDYL